jgi:GAF domain-containing protein/ActR/RegA family two-component response regulator
MTPERAHTLSTLGTLTSAVRSADAERAISAVAMGAVTLLGATMARVWVADPAHGVLRAAGGHGADEETRAMMAHVAEIPYGRSVIGAVFESGRTEYVPDIATERRWYVAPFARELGLRTYVGIPLIVGAERVGVLSLLFRERRDWTAQDGERAALLADQAAIALHNAALFDAAEVRARRLRTLVNLNQLVSSSLDRDTVLTAIARAAAEIMNAAFVGVWVADHASQVLTMGAFSDEYAGKDVRPERLQMGEGAAGWVAARQESLDIPDVEADSLFVGRDWARVYGFRSFHGVPIVLEGTLLGVLSLLGREPFRWRPDDRDVLEGFVGQAAIAIRNAELYRQARDSGDRLRALDEVNRLVSSSLEPGEVLGNVASAAAQFFEAQHVSVWVFDAAAGRLRRSVVRGDVSFVEALPMEVSLGEGAVGWVVLHRAPFVWTDIAEEERAGYVAHLMRLGLRYLAAFPISIGDRLLGALSLHRRTRPILPPETDSLVASLTAQAAVALDHSRLYSETTRRLEETAALLEVTRILASTLDPHDLLKGVAIKAAQVCGVDRCSIFLRDGAVLRPLMSQFADGRKRSDLWGTFRTIRPYDASAVPAQARALETGGPVIVSDTTTSDLVPRSWVERFGVRACLFVPMMRQDGPIGLMALDFCEKRRPFEPRQVDLAVTIAGQLALSFENSRLYEEVRNRLRETTTLLAVGQALSEPTSPVESMRRVAREVGRAFGADMVGAYFFDAAREHLVAVAGYHVPPHLMEQLLGRPMRLAAFPEIAQLWREGRAGFSANPLEDPRFDAAWVEGLPPHSVMFAPAMARGEPMGALFLVWWHPGRSFTPADLTLLEAVGRQVGLAMENAELAQRTEVKLRETETLLSVSRALSSSLDLDELLRHFLRRVASVIEPDSVGVWLVTEDGESLEPVVGLRVPRAMVDALRTVRVSMRRDALYAEAARTRRPVFSTDVPTDDRVPAFLKHTVPHQSQLFVPIVVSDRMIGGFAAAWWERARAFSESELSLMEAVASQAGIAIQNARLFQANRRQLDELGALYELSRAVTGELDRAALLDAVHVKVARALDFRDLVVLLVDEDVGDLEVALRVHDDARDDRSPLRYPRRGVGLMSVVLDTGRPVRTEDYAAACARHGVTPADPAIALRYWLGVPLRTGDATVGVLVLRRGERAFTAADERLLTNIGDLVALALRSARLFDERTRAYRDLAAAQDQLLRTEKLRALGEMASGVAHDFNNLLAAILGRTQLALGRVEDPTLKRWLESVEQAALDGAQTVRRLQEFTRVRRDEPLVPTDLNQVIADALDITQSHWRDEPQSRGLSIEVRKALEPIPRVPGDAAELGEALTNLVLNAVDAMPEGGTITVTSGVVGNEVEISVSDTGVGMSESVKRRVFDPFFTTKGPRGTGLGLSITYGILSRHGARISVESAEGRGSIFRLRFPRTVPVSAPAAPEPQAPRDERSLPPLRCLVVDDDAAVGRLLGDMIEAGGHTAIVLRDGAEAIARFTAEPFDVVFTDLAMPGVNGWQVARATKNLAPDVPVFLITGFGVELTDTERKGHGVDAVLVKPLQMTDMQAVLAETSRRRASRA